MDRYLIKTTETYRVGSEQEAADLIESAKKAMEYTLAKYSSQFKVAKQKGEVIDEWYLVTLHKEFTSEREPETLTSVSYSNRLSSILKNGFETGKVEGFYDEENELIEDMYENED